MIQSRLKVILALIAVNMVISPIFCQEWYALEESAAYDYTHTTTSHPKQQEKTEDDSPEYIPQYKEEELAKLNLERKFDRASEKVTIKRNSKKSAPKQKSIIGVTLSSNKSNNNTHGKANVYSIEAVKEKSKIKKTPPREATVKTQTKAVGNISGSSFQQTKVITKTKTKNKAVALAANNIKTIEKTKKDIVGTYGLSKKAPKPKAQKKDK